MELKGVWQQVIARIQDVCGRGQRGEVKQDNVGGGGRPSL